MSARPAHSAPGATAPGGRPRGEPRRRAFTIVEMLFALAITAMLLVAISLAMHAVLLTYKENNTMAEVTQASRVVLHRMMTEARSADAITTGDQRLSIIPPANDQQLTKIEYELVDGALYYRTTVDGAETSQVMIASTENMQILGFTVARETAVDGEGLTYTRSVTAQLTLKSGNSTFPVTASACPRRNLMF